jgi:hypothetical protein
VGTATNFQIKSSPGGNLAFSYKMNATDPYQYTTIRAPLCNGQAASAMGHWISAQVYAEGPAFVYQSSMENSGEFSLSDVGGNPVGGTSQYFLLFPANTWVTIGDSTGSNISTSTGIGSISLEIHVETGWVGTIYVDNIQLH